MKKRVLVLPLAAVVITALCAYKLSQPERKISAARLVSRRLAPVFDLSNSESPPGRVRLAGYIGRYPIIVVFFDETLGADRDPRMLRLVRAAKQIEAEGIRVFGISGALPPQNRAAIERLEAGGLETPFMLLSDPPPTRGAPARGYLAHRAWGRYDEETRQPLHGIFLIDHAGFVAWGEEGPIPLAPDAPAIEQFLNGD